MDDLAINKALAEIEGLSILTYRHTDDSAVWIADAELVGFSYDPLHDDAQAFRLMVFHKLTVFPGIDGPNTWAARWGDHMEECTDDMDDPARAICLAVLAKHGKLKE